MPKLKIFISYAHADTTPHPVFKVSRLSQIIEELKYYLNCRSPRSRFEFLRDIEIASVSENFRDRIQEAMTACDVAILFISENFSRSEECEAEFAQLAQSGKPLFLVEIEPPLLNDGGDRIKRYRDAVKDVIFAKFWGLDNNQQPVIYGFPLTDDPETRGQYNKTLQAIVGGLNKRAAELPGDIVTNAQAPLTILVACPTADVRSEAIRLTTTLEAKEFSVHAFDPELDVGIASSFTAAFSDALAKCDAYVQLLGAIPGKAVPETNVRLVRAQYDMAKKTGKPSFVSRAADFDIEELEPGYGAFLKGITDCQIGSYVEFEEYLVKKLADLAAQRRSGARRELRLQAPNVRASVPFVAIDAARADSDLARKIADALVDYVNVDHLDYDMTGRKLADAVADYNALILAYGKSSEGQKRTQAHFKLIRRPAGEFSVNGVLELAVGNGAPPTALPCPRGPNVHVITVADEVDGVAMSEFLRKLGVSVPRRAEAS